jgi:hypothetical protein
MKLLLSHCFAPLSKTAAFQRDRWAAIVAAAHGGDSWSIDLNAGGVGRGVEGRTNQTDFIWVTPLDGTAAGCFSGCCFTSELKSLPRSYFKKEPVWFDRVQRRYLRSEPCDAGVRPVARVCCLFVGSFPVRFDKNSMRGKERVALPTA